MSGLSKTPPPQPPGGGGGGLHRGRSEKPFSSPSHPATDLFPFLLFFSVLFRKKPAAPRSKCLTLFTAGRVSLSLLKAKPPQRTEGRHREPSRGRSEFSSPQSAVLLYKQAA